MTATIDPRQWLVFLRTEYLDSFIRDGGTSIKVVVPLDEDMRSGIERDISGLAETTGYVIARVSAAETRVHMIDQLFFRVAEQIPWRQLSRKILVGLAKTAGYAPPAPESTAPVVDGLAVANNLDPSMVQMEARRWIQDQILLQKHPTFRQRSLAKDFRVAVTQLCLAELSGGPDGETISEVITDWLTGRNKAVAAVKPYQIFARVTRSNARHLLESLLLWIRFAGLPGLVILLDLSRVALARNPRDGLVYYTKAAMLDSYEVIRQFIDATDRMKGCLMIVMPALEFLDEEDSGRGIGTYDALRFRVYDEIRDQRLVNPMTALVRLSPGGNVA